MTVQQQACQSATVFFRLHHETRWFRCTRGEAQAHTTGASTAHHDVQNWRTQGAGCATQLYKGSPLHLLVHTFEAAQLPQLSSGSVQPCVQPRDPQQGTHNSQEPAPQPNNQSTHRFHNLHLTNQIRPCMHAQDSGYCLTRHNMCSCHHAHVHATCPRPPTGGFPQLHAFMAHAFLKG